LSKKVSSRQPSKKVSSRPPSKDVSATESSEESEENEPIYNITSKKEEENENNSMRVLLAKGIGKLIPSFGVKSKLPIPQSENMVRREE